MNRSQFRGDLPEPVSRYFDEVAVMQPPNDLLDAAIVEIERTPQVDRFSPLAPVGLAAAAVVGLALLFSGFFSSAPMNVGGDETPIPSVAPTPTPSPRALGGGVYAYLLVEGEGPGGRPWSYWVYTAPCGRAETTALWTSVGYQAVPYLRRGSDLERCVGADTREQPYVVEVSGYGGDGWSFVYGQTRLDVARVAVRLVDGREFEVDTIAAPEGLDWNARFWVMRLPFNLFEFGSDYTVRGYDASGHDVGGDGDAGPAAP
jgi:hypothetical protein